MTLEFILRIFVAAILGGLIGLEREYRAKEAGFRTHFLVALGAALFFGYWFHRRRHYHFPKERECSPRTDHSRWRMGSGCHRAGMWSWYVYGRCFVNSACAARIGSFQLLPPKVRPTQGRRIEIAASMLNKV